MPRRGPARGRLEWSSCPEASRTPIIDTPGGGRMILSGGGLSGTTKSSGYRRVVAAAVPCLLVAIRAVTWLAQRSTTPLDPAGTHVRAAIAEITGKSTAGRAEPHAAQPPGFQPPAFRSAHATRKTARWRTCETGRTELRAGNLTSDGRGNRNGLRLSRRDRRRCASAVETIAHAGLVEMTGGTVLGVVNQEHRSRIGSVGASARVWRRLTVAEARVAA